MADIREFPELNELENRLAELYKEAIEFGLDNIPELQNEFQALKLNEIIIFASWANDNATIGETQLSLGFIIEVPDEILEDRDPINIESFIEARDALSAIVSGLDIEWNLFNEYFSNFDADVSYLSSRSDFIIFKINATDSVQAYSLTNDANIRISEEEPEFIGGPPRTVLDESPADARVEVEEPPDVEGVEANDIIEFPQRDELRLELETAFQDAVMENDEYDIEDFELNRVIIGPPWGDGTADIGDDSLVVNYIISTDIGRIQFSRFTNAVTDDIQNNINFTDVMNQWFNDLNVELLRSEDVDLIRIIRATQGNKLFDISTSEILRVDDDDLVIDEFVSEEEEPPEIIEEEPPEEPPEEVEEELPTVPPEEPEEVVPEFPDVPDPLQPFAVSPDDLEIPAGKETKSVEVRDIYDWEEELASPQGDIDGGIGEAMRQEDGFGIDIAPGTFPRTGTYVKQHLINEGPSYVLEMYNDLVIYSAYISSLFTGQFKTGRYDSFRTFVSRLKLLPERGGPQLIQQLSPQQASARGLKTIPDHPSIEGANAPWLERRVYYTVIEENTDHRAWNNVTEVISELSAE